MSQQGYFANEVTTLGTITSSFIDNEEQFYTGELSGSNFNTFSYSSSYVSPYNPYARVPKNSTSSAAFQEDLPIVNFSTFASQSKTGGTGNAFSSFTSDGVTIDTKTGTIVGARMEFAASQSLIPLQNYLVTFDMNCTVNDFGNPVGLSSFGIQDGVNVRNGAGFGNATGQVNGISTINGGTGYVNGTYPTTPVEGFGTGTGLTLTVVTGLSNIWSIATNGTGYQSGDRVRVLSGNNDAIISLTNAGAVSLSSTGNFVVSHSFMAYPTPDAPLDYQSLTLQAGIGIEATVTNFKVEGVGGEFASQVASIYFNPLQQDQWQVLNTQSILFDNSDYNPLNNFIMPQRSSSFRYALTYDQSQNQPTEIDSVTTWSYDNTSPSASRPNPATLEDSNYTQQAYTLPRYRGSKLKSLDYNFFTPSGTVAPIQAQPTAPYNVGYGYSSSVAEEFLDGATGSYTGDLSYGQTSCINKNPQYIAHFQSSYSPTSFYQSMQFDIDQLIEIPMESIAGQEITPNSIDINGNNEQKKSVSSVFEPNRKLQMTFDELTFNGIQYGLLGAGPFKILNSATVFKTINSNARNFANESQAYQYQQAGVPVSSSVQTDAGVIQMVTGSNILDSFELPAEVTALGEIINSGTGYSTGGPATTTGGNGSGLTVGVVAASGFVTSVSIVNGGDGYLPGDRVKVLGSGDGNCEVEISTVGPTPVQHNGFLLSGSNTLFTTLGTVTGVEIKTAGSSGTTGVKNTTGGQGTGLRINVLTLGGGNSMATIALDDGGAG